MNNKERVKDLQRRIHMAEIDHDRLVERCGAKATEVARKGHVDQKRYLEFVDETNEALAPLMNYCFALRRDLDWAIVQGEKLKLPMGSCKVLSVQLEFNKFEKEYLLGAKVELGDLKRLIKPSRVRPDHPVTKWYRQHKNKYKTQKLAVEAYVEIHSGNYIKLYNALRNDLKNHPPEQEKRNQI
jgi:hypothetical protein